MVYLMKFQLVFPLQNILPCLVTSLLCRLCYDQNDSSIPVVVCVGHLIDNRIDNRSPTIFRYNTSSLLPLLDYMRDVKKTSLTSLGQNATASGVQ